MPTLDLTKATVDENNEPILYPLVYSNYSFGTKDLPMIFGYAITQSVKFYKEHSPLSLEQRNFGKNDSFNKQANQARLDMVDKILCAAYGDDLSCHEFFASLVVYFIHTYSCDERMFYIQTNFPSLKNPKKMIQSESNFV